MDIVSYTHARQNLKAVLDKVVDNSEPTVIFRQNGAPVVIMSKVDYDALDTTEYLLSSKANVRQLDESIAQLKRGEVIAKTIDELLALENEN